MYMCMVVSEKAMAPHSSTLAWKIPWKEEPDRPQSMGSQKVGHDWAIAEEAHQARYKESKEWEKSLGQNCG